MQKGIVIIVGLMQKFIMMRPIMESHIGMDGIFI